MSADAGIADVLEGRARWCVVTGECETILPLLPPASVAHVVTDPPYSAALYERTRTNKGSGRRPNGKPTNRADRMERERTSPLQLASKRIGAIDEILDECAAHFLRVASRWVMAFHDCEIGDRWRNAFGATYVRTGAWVKSNPMPQVSADRPAAGFEPCTIAYASRGRGRMRWNGGGKAALWIHANCSGPERPDHPCPKPLSLMREIVMDFTDPDDLGP